MEAFLETGRPLPPVLLRRTSPLRSSSDSVRNAATEAEEVVLELGGETYTYTESGTPGRYVSKSSGTIPPQTPWELRVQWRDETARARGETPSLIDISEVCIDVPSSPSQAVQVDSIRRDSLDIPADLGYIFPVDVTLLWSRPDNTPVSDTSAWVRAQLRPNASPFPSEVVDFFLQPAEVRREDKYLLSGGRRQWRGVYAVPVDSTDPDLLPTHDLSAALVRGDTAFAAFAQTRTDPNRREPISNVEGGLGIATAVAVDSVVVDSISQPGVNRCLAPE